MGQADKRARELIDRVEDGGAPAGGHLDALTAVARDVDVKRVRRRRAVELIAAMEGREAVAVAARLTLEPWMNADTQERVVERLLGRGFVTTVVPMLASGELDERVYTDGIQHLAAMPPDDLVAVLVPFVSAPGPCDAASLLGLMRVLAAGGDDGAKAVAALASDPEAPELVRTEAGYALERERMDLVAHGDELAAMEAEDHTLTFYASRFRAESFERRLRSYAEGSGIPYRATIGEGRLWREVTVTVTARPATVADVAHYARAIGRFRGDRGGPGHGGPWNSGDGFGDLGGWGDFGGGSFGGGDFGGGGGGGGGDGGGGGGGG